MVNSLSRYMALSHALHITISHILLQLLLEIFACKEKYRWSNSSQLGYYRTAPTQEQILVPETLLKKRKSQEKQREENAAEREKKRKVGLFSLAGFNLKLLLGARRHPARW